MKRRYFIVIAIIVAILAIVYILKDASEGSLQEQNITMDNPEGQRLRYTDEINATGISKAYHVSGKGVRVTIMGEIVDASHPELQKRVHKQYNTISQKGKVLQGKGNMPYMFEKFGHGDGHGTHIAGTIAAEWDGLGIMGIAPEATLDVYDIGAYGNEKIPIKGWESTESYGTLLGAFRHALIDITKNNKSKIVTGSFNVESPYIRYEKDTQFFNRSVSQIEKEFGDDDDVIKSKMLHFANPKDRDYLKHMMIKNRGEDAEGIALGTLLPLTKEWHALEDAIALYQKSGGVYIVTESNNIFDGRTSALNAMPTFSPKVDKDLWLSVVMAAPRWLMEANSKKEAKELKNKYGDQYITPMNSCGAEAQKYCILTPSYFVFSTMTKKVAELESEFDILDGRGYQTFTGHSMGAPMVAGALALMQEYNQKMHFGYTMKDLVNILKQSADKSFKGYDPHKHGQGILNIKNALKMMKDKHAL